MRKQASIVSKHQQTDIQKQNLLPMMIAFTA
jgi:hypothetical protein